MESLLDDWKSQATADETASLSVRPDFAAVAVLVARAIEATPGLLHALRRGCPVVSIAASGADLVAIVERIVDVCALGASDEPLSNRGGGRGRWRSEEPGLIIAKDGTEKDAKPGAGNDDVRAALHRQVPIVGIASDPARHLPRDLMRAAEYKIALGQLDATALDLVVEAVVGSVPVSKFDAEMIKQVELSDLVLAIRAGQSADDCIDRLRELVSQKSAQIADGPTLDQLDGFGQARIWGLELASDFADLKAGRISWADVDHKGVLIAGPPGVGKTMFARALANSARVPLVATSVAEWNAANYLSGTLQAMRKAFEKARQVAPCILFIDEMDGISDRSRLHESYVEYWTQIVNQLLELLAGVEERTGIVVVGATNFPHKIDPAIRRAGRLDHMIVIDKPDAMTLSKIFRHHLGERLPDVDLRHVARAAVGATGADVEAIVRQAKGSARRAGTELSNKHLLTAVRKCFPALTDSVRRRVAVHEAGHVLVAHALGLPVAGVAIHVRGGDTDIPNLIPQAATRVDLEHAMTVLMAGRAAEQLVFGNVAVGSGNEGSDLARATEIAKCLELQFGLGDFGAVYVPGDLSVAAMMDKPVLDAIRSHIERAAAKADMIVRQHRSALHLLSTRLESTGALSADEINAIVSPSDATDDRTAEDGGSTPISGAQVPLALAGPGEGEGTC